MLKLFFAYLRPYRFYFWLGLLCLVFVDIMDVALPLVIKYAVDNVALFNQAFTPHIQEDLSILVFKVLLWCAVTYVGITILQGIGRLRYRLYLQGTSLRIAQDIRNDFFQHIQKLSLNFYNRTNTGDLMSRATNDIETVRMFYAMGIFIGVDLLMYLLTVPFIMVFLSVKLTLLSIILFPLLPFFANRMSHIIHSRFKDIQATFSEMSNYAQENFSGMRIVKSFTQEDHQTNGFKNINEKYVHQNIGLARRESIFGPTLQLCAGLSMVIVLFVGGIETINGRIPIGTMVAFPMFIGRVMWPMMALGWTIGIFQRSFASMQRLQEIFRTQPEIVSAPVEAAPKITRGMVEFRDVSLRYPEAPYPALQNINLQIPAGRIVAVVGPVGCGKTSLVNLLPRLFDPSQGTVLIDGIDIRNIPLPHLRSEIGFVPQDVFLFSESIKDNIAFGLKEEAATLELITQPAQVAMVHQDIEDFTHKYDTLLGERGINLSGGQKQRITIARALAKNPRVLVLDDCLSSVDVNTEEEILGRLKEALRQRTTIIISHRLPVIKLADVIIFMENGQVAEKGTHEELMAHQGRYAGFYRKQELISDLEKT